MRRLVGREPGHAEAEHARREDVGAVDHQREGVAAGRLRCPRLSARTGDGVRVVAEVDVAELGAEACDELLAELLVRARAVLDDDDLVVEVVDAALVRAGERVQRARRLAPHVVEDDDDREVDRRRLGAAERRAARVPATAGAAGSSVGVPDRAAGSALRHVTAGAVDALERRGDAVAGAERRRPLARTPGRVRRRRRRSRRSRPGRRAPSGRAASSPTPTRRCAAARRSSIGASASVSAGRALQEPDPVVEQVEALEAVAHEVEVGQDVGDPPTIAAAVGRALPCRCRSGRPEPVGDPDRAVVQLVGVEVAAQEDRRRRRGRCRTRPGRRRRPRRGSGRGSARRWSSRTRPIGVYGRYTLRSAVGGPGSARCGAPPAGRRMSSLS